MEYKNEQAGTKTSCTIRETQTAVSSNKLKWQHINFSACWCLIILSVICSIQEKENRILNVTTNYSIVLCNKLLLIYNITWYVKATAFSTHILIDWRIRRKIKCPFERRPRILWARNNSRKKSFKSMNSFCRWTIICFCQVCLRVLLRRSMWYHIIYFCCSIIAFFRERTHHFQIQIFGTSSSSWNPSLVFSSRRSLKLETSCHSSRLGDMNLNNLN